ncbi:MAG: tRNA 2-thiouridine(34) synthase MnmA [Candidatus Omnitrophota bacterium]
MSRILVAMSGGIDSSIAAFLLKQRGNDVIGVTMRLCPEGIPAGSRLSLNLERAARAAKRIGIEHYILDLEEEFNRCVVDYFCYEYSRGRTPNPCIVCNEKIKFVKLLEKAKSLGAGRIATGHYAGVGYDKVAGRYFILEGRDKIKDQSYFLFNMTQEQLERASFPLSDLSKKEVREMARLSGLDDADGLESQDICFIPNNDYRAFLKNKIERIVPGNIVDTQGKVLGKHKSIAFYTIGQREGLGIAAGKPLYVVRIDAENNNVVLGGAEEAKSRELCACGVLWMAFAKPAGEFRAKARIRYNHSKADCRVLPVSKGGVKVIFDEPQYAVTPGQAVVFYDGEKVLGGGWIE